MQLTDAPPGAEDHAQGERKADMLVHGPALAGACLLSYSLNVDLLVHVDSLSRPDELLGGMWAVIATVFVYRTSYTQSITAAVSRATATLVSFALCFIYLVFFPFHSWGLALLIGAGVIVVTLLGRSDDTVTTGITTAVVMVVAALSPHDAWEQPILRVFDTGVGVAVGLVTSWIGLRVLQLSYRHPGRPARRAALSQPAGRRRASGARQFRTDRISRVARPRRELAESVRVPQPDTDNKDDSG